MVRRVKVLKQALWTSTVHDLMPVILGVPSSRCNQSQLSCLLSWAKNLRDGS